MITTTQKTNENKSQSNSNDLSQKKKDNTSISTFEDNRPEAIQLRKIQEIADNSSDSYKKNSNNNKVNQLSSKQVIQREISSTRMDELIIALEKRAVTENPSGNVRWPFKKDCEAVMTGSKDDISDYKQLQQEYKKRKDPEYKKLQEAQALVAANKLEKANKEEAEAIVLAFIEQKNPSQVFKQFYNNLVTANVTIGDKRAGGPDPNTGKQEDGVTTYSRTYSFLPKINVKAKGIEVEVYVGEVHVHWRNYKNVTTVWYPSKVHFKKRGSENKTGSANQRNLSLSEINSIGMVAQSDEKFTNKLGFDV